MENPLEIRRSHSQLISSNKEETIPASNKFDNSKPPFDPENRFTFNSSIDSEHQPHCEYKQEATTQCECTIETFSQEDDFSNIIRDSFYRKNVHNGLSPLDILKGSINSEPEGLNNHTGTNTKKESLGFSGNESPLHFGLNYYIDSSDNLQTKSSQESSAQEDNNNPKKKNPRSELNNQVAELLLDNSDRNQFEGLSSDILLRNIKSEIVEGNINGLPFLGLIPQPQSAISLGINQEEERKVENFRKYNKEDFEKFKRLGGGAYATVYLVKRSNSKMYALKRMHKDFLIRERKDYQVYVEKEVLKRLKNSPKSNIVKLYCSFEDNDYIYFLMEYIDGGDFWTYLANHRQLPKDQIIYFTAQMINILEYMHSCGIAHRDFKPENILLKTNGQMKCIDFATAKFLDYNKRTIELFSLNQSLRSNDPDSEGSRAARVTFNGTRHYVSPEVLENRDSGAPADLWALGSIVYLMATGNQAFSGNSNYVVYEKIKKFEIDYPSNMDPDVKDLIKKLMIKEPHLRLGAGIKGSKNDYEALKGHPLFNGIDFDKVHLMKVPLFPIESTFSKDYGNLKSQCEPKTRPKAYSQQDPGNSKPAKIISIHEPPILSDSVKKNLGWFFPMYKERQLILTSTRLLYYDPTTNEPLGEIPLLPSTKAVLGSTSKNKFEVRVPNREYIFKEGERPASEWVKAINETVAKLHKKK